MNNATITPKSIRGAPRRSAGAKRSHPRTKEELLDAEQARRELTEILRPGLEADESEFKEYSHEELIKEFKKDL